MLLIYLHNCFHKNILKYKSKTKNPKCNTKIREKKNPAKINSIYTNTKQQTRGLYLIE